MCENIDYINQKISKAEKLQQYLIEIDDEKERLVKFKELENMLVDINESFQHFATLVENQQDQLNKIGKF